MQVMKRLLAALAVLSSLSASLAQAATVAVSGWEVHNGTSTVGGPPANPTFTPGDNLTLMGSFGLFFTLFLLFCRYLPIVAMAEVKSVLPQANPHYAPKDSSNAAAGYAETVHASEKH